MTLLINRTGTTTHKCPKCGDQNVSRAHRVGGLDRMLSLLHIYPYRCRQHDCKVRFHRFGRSA